MAEVASVYRANFRNFPTFIFLGGGEQVINLFDYW